MSYTKTGSQPLSPTACEISPELAKVQDLMPISDEDRAALRESIRRDGIREPLRGYFENRKFMILSGLNRWQIALELKLPLVPVETVETDDREAFAIDENRARRQLTTPDKKRLAAWFITQSPESSDLAISKKTGLSDKTVASVRAELAARSEIPNVEKRTDSKGRKQAASKPKASKNTPSDRTGSFQARLVKQGRGSGGGVSKKALRAFNSALNTALNQVKLESTETLAVAVRHAKSWLKNLESRHITGDGQQRRDARPLRCPPIS